MHLRLIAVERQHIVATLVDNVGSNRGLAPGGINRDGAVGEVQQRQEQRNGGDFV